MSRTVVVCLGALVCLLVVLFAVFLFGGVEGREFSPQAFTSRRFWYWRIPLTNLQVWPLQRQAINRPLEQHLLKNQLIPSANPPNRWDLVASYRLGTRWHTGDALIWEQYGTAMNDDGSEFFWLLWTRNHPQLARLLWPEVAKVLRDDLYFLLPDLFDLAEPATAVEPFGRDLKSLLAQRYEQLAEMEVKLEKYQVAETWYTRALSYDPQCASCLAGQARCRRKSPSP